MIIILTSYKGGTGKSTVALSIAEWARKNGLNFVLIDTNPQNSNLAEDIFFYFHVHETATPPDYIGGNKTVYMIPPNGTTSHTDMYFTVYDATDQDPFAIAKKIQMNDTSDTIFIIDTNKHIRSCPPSPFSKEGHHDVFTWFLWGWSSPRLDPQLNAIINATFRLEEAWPKSHVVHVFNLYDFYVGGVFSLGIRKTSTTLKPLKKVVNEINRRIRRFEKNNCSSIYVDCDVLLETMRELHGALVRYIVADDNSMSELPAIWSEYLLKLIKQRKKAFPCNILIIPTFFRELVMPIDRLVLSSPRNFEAITKQIKPMAEHIETFLGNLVECKDISERASEQPEEDTIVRKRRNRKKNTS